MDTVTREKEDRAILILDESHPRASCSAASCGKILASVLQAGGPKHVRPIILRQKIIIKINNDNDNDNN